jgi:hypothetical protein
LAGRAGWKLLAGMSVPDKSGGPTTIFQALVFALVQFLQRSRKGKVGPEPFVHEWLLPFCLSTLAPPTLWGHRTLSKLKNLRPRGCWPTKHWTILRRRNKSKAPWFPRGINMILYTKFLILWQE